MRTNPSKRLAAVLMTASWDLPAAPALSTYPVTSALMLRSVLVPGDDRRAGCPAAETMRRSVRPGEAHRMTRALDHDDLYALATASDPQLSADGRWAAWLVTTVDRDKDSYKTAIWLADLHADGVPRRLTQGDAESSPRFSPDGRRLAFVAAREGDKPQVHVLPLDGGEA